MKVEPRSDAEASRMIVGAGGVVPIDFDCTGSGVNKAVLGSPLETKARGHLNRALALMLQNKHDLN